MATQNKTGILSLLDEECLLPGDTSDVTFLHKVDYYDLFKYLEI